MTTVVVLGGTGYTGANLVAEAASRGIEVISWSRNLPETPVPGVTYETGSVLDADTLARAIKGADVVVGSVSPHGELADGKLRSLYTDAAALAAVEGARWIAVGGFSSLRTAPGEGRIAFGGGVPPQFLEEAQTAAHIADDLEEKAPAGLDWLFVSPAATYGSHAPGQKRGTYRTSDHIAIFDEAGESAISGVDFATAVVDEIEHPRHHRTQIGFAY